MHVTESHSITTKSIAALLLSLTLGFFAPLTIYFTNVREFHFSLYEVLPYLAAISILLFILIGLLLLILKNRLREVDISLTFTSLKKSSITSSPFFCSRIFQHPKNPCRMQKR